MPITIGQLFRPDDIVGRWVFKLATLLDDLRLLDSRMREEFEKKPNDSVAFFRMIIARLYEGRPIVREMWLTLGVVRFLADEVSGADDAFEVLRDAYRRPDPDTNSRVEDAYERVRHLTVHYSTKPGELPRILRAARDVQVRIHRDERAQSLIYLFPQDVMEQALLAEHPAKDANVEFAHDLTQAFTKVFTNVMRAYFKRMGVDEDDIAWVAPERDADS